jgi:hypothetical protein
MGFGKWDNQAELEKVLVETRGEEPNPDLLSQGLELRIVVVG